LANGRSISMEEGAKETYKIETEDNFMYRRPLFSAKQSPV
jgi:hypothetical protein